MSIPQAHLTPRRTITRSQVDTRAFPLSELNMPKGDGTAKGIHLILEWLDVEKSKRYIKINRTTFCNIYAHDYARLMGAYIPRVWWTDKAIKDKSFDTIVYARNVIEMNVNMLYDWFPKYGSMFGWKEVNITEGQIEANKGKCVVMLAANLNSARSGHIVAIVPETDKVKAVGASGIIIYPVQSQAGSVNKRYFASKWWDGHKKPRIYVKENN